MDYKKIRQMYKKYSKVNNENKFLKKEIENKKDEITSIKRHLQQLEELIDEKKAESEKLRLINQQNLKNFETYKKENEEEIEKFKKRIEKEKNEIVLREKRKFLIDFIDVLGHFEYALNSINDENTKKGIEMVYNEFIKALEKHGVEVIQEENVPFDSNIHNAIGQEKRENVSPNTVIKIVRKGFKVGDRIIRPADCIVSK